MLQGCSCADGFRRIRRAAAASQWQNFVSAEEQTIKQKGTIGQSVGFMVTGPTTALLSIAAHLSSRSHGADHSRLSHRWLSTQGDQLVTSFKGSNAVFVCRSRVRECEERQEQCCAQAVGCGWWVRVRIASAGPLSLSRAGPCSLGCIPSVAQACDMLCLIADH